MELARYGILVNALAPGYIETDFNRDFFQTEAGKALIGRIPLKRIGQAPDLDGALLVPGVAGERLCHRRGYLGRWRPRRCRDLIRIRLARFLARGERREKCRGNRAGAAARRRDPGELGLRGRIYRRRLRRTSSAWCCAPTRRPASPSSLGRIEEFAVLKAAFAAGVTVPEPLWACADPEVIGKPFFVMRRVAGTAQGTADHPRPGARAGTCRRSPRGSARNWRGSRRSGRRAPTSHFCRHDRSRPRAHRRVSRLSRPASAAAAGARMGDPLARNAHSGAAAAGAVPPRFPHRQLHAGRQPS